MRVCGGNVLEAIYASWAAQDLEAVLSCFSDDLVIVIHAPADIVPWAGETRGKAQLEHRLRELLREFEFRQLKTGHEMEGTLRHIWQADGDKIVRLEEFHDIERLRAFFQLLATAGAKS